MGRLRAKSAAVAVPASAAASSRRAAATPSFKPPIMVPRKRVWPVEAPRLLDEDMKMEDAGNEKGADKRDHEDMASSPAQQLPADSKSTIPRITTRRRSRTTISTPQTAAGRRHQTRQRTRLQTKLSALRNRGTQLMDLPPEIRLLILQSLLSTSELLSLRKGTYVEPKQPSDFPQHISWHDLYCPDFSSSEVEAYAAILALADGGHGRSGYMSLVHALDSRFATARGKARTLIEEAGEVFWRNKFWVGLEGARGLELRAGLGRSEGISRVRRLGSEMKYFSHEEGDNSASGALKWLLDDKYSSLKSVDVYVKGTCTGGYCRPSSAYLSQVSKAVRDIAAKRGSASLTWEYPYEGVMNGSYTVTRPRPWASSSTSSDESAPVKSGASVEDSQSEDPKNTIPVEDLILGASFSTSPTTGREELEHRYDGRKCFKGFNGPRGWLSWKKRNDQTLWRTLRIVCACGTLFWEDERVEEIPSTTKKERPVKSEPFDES